jgi:hydroxybutyrate-dimer hydrolase
MDMRFPATLPLLLGACLALAACVDDGDGPELNQKPAFVSGTVRTTTYDGSSDDLLTGGVGKSGLASATAPGYADPAAPTAAELRRNAIYVNYRALVDTAAAGGYGTFYGPNVDSNGVAGSGEGKIAGTETLAYSDDGSGRRNVTLMAQVPDSFDVNNPCIITATSSGSRGVYGAISVGEWGLKHGCAVAYTDKGSATAPHDLATDTVSLIDGTRTSSAAAGNNALFRADLSSSELAAFNSASPNRLAYKHAHSRQNPEKDWGTFTLQAIEFTFWVLNERYGTAIAGNHERRFKPGNTLVIASSLSNGGGASIAAAELDTQGWIDGVAVSEPSLQMPASPAVSVQRGSTVLPLVARPLADFITFANLYQPCASESASETGAPGVALISPALATNRCATLKAQGLLTGNTLAEQSDESLQLLHAHGWEPEADPVHPSHAALEVASSVAVTYANAYSRARVSDKLCGFSFGTTNGSGAIVPTSATALAQMFATGNGVPPSSGVQLVNDNSVGGPVRSLLSVSPSSGLQDFNTDGAVCLRNLWTGADAAALALHAGVDETRRSGNLRGKPALIVHGRSDALIPVNHTSRPYTALNRVVEGSASKLSYIEVANGQHFDAFIDNAALPGFDSRFVPVHLYLIRAMDAMYAHLKNGTALPASQVVRTVPRGGTPGAAPALSASNVPPIVATPAVGDAITVSGSTLVVPD